jgi:hypothetical protein
MMGLLVRKLIRSLSKHLGELPPNNCCLISSSCAGCTGVFRRLILGDGCVDGALDTTHVVAVELDAD